MHELTEESGEVDWKVFLCKWQESLLPVLLWKVYYFYKGFFYIVIELDSQVLSWFIWNFVIAIYEIGWAGRTVWGDEVSLCGLSNEESEAQGLGLTQGFSLRQKKKNLADVREKWFLRGQWATGRNTGNAEDKAWKKGTKNDLQQLKHKQNFVPELVYHQRP